MLTRSGLLLPFGRPGTTSEGRITVAAGAITWPEDVSWVKLLLEHDQTGPVLGYAIDLHETEAGIRGTFAFPLPEHHATADALAGIDAQLREGLSAGIDFDDATKVRIRRAQGAAVPGSGHLREASLAAVPAFEGARFDRPVT